jgi:hypothetical protein
VTITITNADIITAFDEHAIGSKVLPGRDLVLREIIQTAVETHEFPDNGQAFITLPSGACGLVSTGVARHETLADEDLFVRRWRGNRTVFAPRSAAVPVEVVHVVVYTLDAYAADPEVDPVELARHEGSTHVLVALLACAGPSPLSPMTLLNNIAGGNNEYIPVSKLDTDGDLTVNSRLVDLEPDVLLLHKIIGLARDTLAYSKEWCLVADEKAAAS